MRIALPPIINQFLNLVKNSSLATALGYPEITALTKTAIGNGNPAPQLILLLMGCLPAVLAVHLARVEHRQPELPTGGEVSDVHRLGIHRSAR